MAEQSIICGNNIELLKQYPDNYFDSIVTDAPYGLGKEPDAAELMKDWIDKGYHEIKGTGFMGKEWDSFVPQPLFWKEAFRVLKHGGHVLSFFGTRTYDWGVMAMRFAGFEVRDTITWNYGSGFPKSHNLSKALDKMAGAERKVVGTNGTRPIQTGGKINSEASANGSFEREDNYITAPSTDAAKQWDGWGTALKPASEPIVLARKPLEKGLSIAENVLKYGTGGINIDGCRIPTENINELQKNWDRKKGEQKEAIYKGNWRAIELNNYAPQGRFPANVIFSHHTDCECVGVKKVKSFNFNRNFDDFDGKEISNNIYGKGYKREIPKIPFDENGMETMEDWNCVDGCPIKELDKQSGVSKSSASIRNNKNRNDKNIYGNGKGIPQMPLLSNHSDKGGASRFFYCAKASKSERNKGLEEFEEGQTVGGGGGIGNYIDDVNSTSGKYGSEKAPNKNIHPTVKPVSLMRYLVRLITPPDGIVLDPFNGSGTTGIAAKLEGLNYVGLELDAEYCKISEARINSYNEAKEQEESVKTDSQLNLF